MTYPAQSMLGKQVVLVDKFNKTKFTLDSTKIFITAVDSNGKQLWQTDPWKDTKLMTYRVKRPVIVRYELVKSERTKNKEVIWIVYNNTQFGEIDKRTGKFHCHGQD
jgi:hypothetical protein